MTQAIFKKAQKAAKAAPQKAASATKKLQRSAPSPVKKVQSAAKKVPHGLLPCNTCTSALHCFGSRGALATDSRPLTGSDFVACTWRVGDARLVVSQVQKASPVKKAASALKAGSKRTKGWLGGEGGAQDLDKWYGVALLALQHLGSSGSLALVACGAGGAFRASSATSSSQTNVKFHAGPDRALFLPGGLLDAADVPAYLNGSLAGDYGYDPLGLGKDTETVEKYRAYELLHARWAMLAAAGIIIPEGLQARAAHTSLITLLLHPWYMACG